MHSLWTRASSYNRHTRALRRLPVLFAVGALTVAGCSPVTQVSVSYVPGAEPDGDSDDLKLSDDGRYAVFASEATNLTANDTNAFKDVFLRDNQTGTTELISRTTGGLAGNNLSSQPDVSGDGRYIAYWSFASDLIPVDTNAVSDVFVYDRQTGFTERVSVDSNENQLLGSSLGGSISADGRYVAFYTDEDIASNDSNNDFDIYLRDRQLGITTLISEDLGGVAAGQSFEPVISADGKSLIFQSFASDLVSGDTNGQGDVFYINLEGTNSILNITLGGNATSQVGDVSVLAAGGSLAFDIVAFSSAADNLTTENDINGVTDVFLRAVRRSNNTPTLLFQMTLGNGPSFSPSIANVGSFRSRVAFVSSATDLRPPGALPADTNGATDVYLWSNGSPTGASFPPATTNVRLISRTFSGGLSDSDAYSPAISNDGEAIAWHSNATNLTFDGSSNNVDDAYVRPSYEPLITGVGGWLVPGETRVITLTGEFRDGASGDQVLVGGDGIVSTLVDVTPTTITVTVELAPTAALGPRTLIVYNDAPQLGIVAPFGSADSVDIAVLP